MTIYIVLLPFSAKIFGLRHQAGVFSLSSTADSLSASSPAV